MTTHANSCCRAILVGLALDSALFTTGLAQEETYRNPVDKKTYTAPGGWKSYTPEGPVEVTKGKVSIAGVRLLQSQDEIASRTTAQELATFLDQAHEAAVGVFASYAKRAVIMVQFTCVPGKCPPTIAYQNGPPQELLQAYYDKLARLPPLRVSGEVKFQLTLQVQP